MIDNEHHANEPHNILEDTRFDEIEGINLAGIKIEKLNVNATPVTASYDNTAEENNENIRLSPEMEDIDSFTEKSNDGIRFGNDEMNFIDDLKDDQNSTIKSEDSTFKTGNTLNVKKIYIHFKKYHLMCTNKKYIYINKGKFM